MIKKPLNEIYDLDILDGYQFEDAVADLFLSNGYSVKMGARVNDKGRDLILTKDTEQIVVECKHWVGTVGRPVVQKLHSSILTLGGANRGFVVTTGRFSSEASEYIDEILRTSSTQIELIDFAALVSYGKKVGIHFVSKKRGNSVHFRVPWRTKSEIDIIWNAFVATIRSHPRNALSVVTSFSANQIIKPFVKVKYSLHKTFVSSNRCLHTATDSGSEFYNLDESAFAEHEMNIWQNEQNELFDSAVQDRPPSAFFDADLSRFSSKTAKTIAQKHSISVHYKGRNNHNYTSNCTTHPSDVSVSTKRLLTGKWIFEFQIDKKNYGLTIADIPNTPLPILEKQGFSPGFSTKLDGALLCNDCALLVLNAKDSIKQSGICKSCRKTLCKNHLWNFIVSDLFLSTHYCSSCYPRAGHKILQLFPWIAIVLGLIIWINRVADSKFMTDQVLLCLQYFFLGSVILFMARMVWHLRNLLKLRKYEPIWKL